MKVVFPLATDINNIEFGNEPIEKFIDGGVYEDKIKNKRIFYVIEPNVFNTGGYKKQLKIGISHSPTSRLQNYRNYYGANTLSNENSGAHVRLILSTNIAEARDLKKSNPNFAIASLEGKLKRHFKNTGKVLRGTEWLELGEDTLKNNIQKSLPKSKKDKMTHSPHTTRSRPHLRPK
jgi:hypothetical protein